MIFWNQVNVVFFCYRRLVHDSLNSYWVSFITNHFLRSQVCSSLQRCSSEEIVANMWWTPKIAFTICIAFRQSLNSHEDRLAKKKASDNISGVTVLFQLFCVMYMYIGVTAKCFLFSSLVSLCLWSLIHQGTILYIKHTSLLYSMSDYHISVIIYVQQYLYFLWTF